MRKLFPYIEQYDDPSDFSKPFEDCFKEGHRFGLLAPKGLHPAHSSQTYWKEFRRLFEELKKQREKA